MNEPNIVYSQISLIIAQHATTAAYHFERCDYAAAKKELDTIRDILAQFIIDKNGEML